MGKLLLSVEDMAGEKKKEGQERFGYEGNVVAVIQLCLHESHMISRHVGINGASEHLCSFSFWICIIHMRI